ncbi:MAG: transposase [Thermoplasmata archaeon]|nr:transposase [Thermoplasmata archaeon]
MSDPEAGAALKTLDANSLPTNYAPGRGRSMGHISGLSRGRRIELTLKYWATYGPNNRPMSGTRGPWDEATEVRAINLATSHRRAVRPNGRVSFNVESSDGEHEYSVTADDSGWSCDCPVWTERKSPCKHVVAVVKWLDPNPPPIIDEEMEAARKTYRHPDWGRYDEALQQEHQVFDRLLWDLLGLVREPLREVGRPGRPAIPLRTQILVATRKVHLGQSNRRARGLLVALNRDGKGILPRVPNYSAPSRFFNAPGAGELLLGLVERSGLVLKDIEDRGTSAIDSSGFCTTNRGAYLTEVHDPDRRHKWLKAHVIVGVKTHIVLSASITDEHGADYSQFIPLLKRVKFAGHNPRYIVADKAYLGRSNFDAAAGLGIEPYIPFKINSRGLSKGAPLWNRKYHEFLSKRDEFDERYHQRSNVEATFSAIKRKLGEPLFSRTPEAQVCEVLAKILAYNVGIVIKESCLHDLAPGPIGYSVLPWKGNGGESEEAAA